MRAGVLAAEGIKAKSREIKSVQSQGNKEYLILLCAARAGASYDATEMRTG